MSGPALPYTMQDLFRMMAQREAIDLFVKPGVQPMFRLASGGLHAFGFAAPSPEATEALAGQVMSDENRQDLEQSGHTDLAYWEPRLGRFRLNVYLQRGTVALVARRVIREIPSFETLRLPPVVGGIRPRAPRPRPGDWTRGLGEVHDARVDDRLPESHGLRPYHYH